jgi:hypothetical protein
MKVCVVIPVHRSNPSTYELISFKQCYKILGNHSIKLVAPIGMDMGAYQNVVDEVIEVVYINPQWLSSILHYNKLKVSRYFYDLFKDYEFMLTYELDAFVFRDDLLYWCQQDYDYIGAPWFKDYLAANENKEFFGVGNSGFSLRKIKSIIYVLENLYYEPSFFSNLTFTEKIQSFISYPYNKIRNLGKENYSIQNYFNTSEDLFYAQFVTTKYRNFVVAPIEDAIRFSFEVSPEVLYDINNNILPFGCHAWWRYNLEFWKPYIHEYGYEL